MTLLLGGCRYKPTESVQKKIRQNHVAIGSKRRYSSLLNRSGKDHSRQFHSQIADSMILPDFDESVCV